MQQEAEFKRLTSEPLPDWEGRDKFFRDATNLGKKYGVYCWQAGEVEDLIRTTIKGFDKVLEGGGRGDSFVLLVACGREEVRQN